MSGGELLKQYLAVKGISMETDGVEIGPFGDSPQMAERLLGLVLAGKKRATCWACLDEEPPEKGELTVMTDWAGEKGCVLQTVRAQRMRFSCVTWELARKEGEDERFETWREGHARFFAEEGAREGYAFSEDMEIIFEEFRVVWPEEYADEK